MKNCTVGIGCFLVVALSACGGGSPTAAGSPDQESAVVPGTPTPIASVADQVDVHAMTYDLSAADVEQREAAVHSLGRLTSPEAMDALIMATLDHDPVIRTDALEELVDKGGARLTAGASQGLIDEDQDVRLSVVHMLADQPAVQVIPHLEFALTDPDPRVRAAAADVLQDIRNDASFQ